MTPAARLLQGLVVAYQRLLSPILPASCRYLPSCSEYAVEALRSFGALRGSVLAARRLCRCHPWGGCGLDPVPSSRQAADGPYRGDGPERTQCARLS